MDTTLAVISVLATGAGLNTRGVKRRNAAAGLTAADIAAATGLTTKTCRTICHTMHAAGVVSVIVDNAGVVGRPAYRWHCSAADAAAFYCGADATEDHIAAFLNDLAIAVYSFKKRGQK